RNARSGPGHSQVSTNTIEHPVQATLDAITASGAQVWRTDQHGTVTITFQGGVPAVVADR
ncbi:MAG TPA: MBL fold metallo-hydrolase, partial [Candidatus Binatia bacterium]|nr:MBL fold metallo-hydrolase [Candidatus Binatia bacterium]